MVLESGCVQSMGESIDVPLQVGTSFGMFSLLLSPRNSQIIKNVDIKILTKILSMPSKLAHSFFCDWNMFVCFKNFRYGPNS